MAGHPSRLLHSCCLGRVAQRNSSRGWIYDEKTSLCKIVDTNGEKVNWTGNMKISRSDYSSLVLTWFGFMRRLKKQHALVIYSCTVHTEGGMYSISDNVWCSVNSDDFISTQFHACNDFMATCSSSAGMVLNELYQQGLLFFTVHGWLIVVEFVFWPVPNLGTYPVLCAYSWFWRKINFYGKFTINSYKIR